MKSVGEAGFEPRQRPTLSGWGFVRQRAHSVHRQRLSAATFVVAQVLAPGSAGPAANDRLKRFAPKQALRIFLRFHGYPSENAFVSAQPSFPDPRQIA